jgi:hypothetical protein
VVVGVETNSPHFINTEIMIDAEIEGIGVNNFPRQIKVIHEMMGAANIDFTVF